MEQQKGILNKAAVGATKPTAPAIPTPAKRTKSTIKTYTVKVAFCGFEEGEKITRDSSMPSVQKCVERGLIE